MPNIELNENDIVIKRVSNGWVVNHTSESDSNHVLTKVFEDSQDLNFDIDSAYSLISTLYYCFDEYLQSKKSAGIVIELKEKGYDQ